MSLCAQGGASGPVYVESPRLPCVMDSETTEITAAMPSSGAPALLPAVVMIHVLPLLFSQLSWDKNRHPHWRHSSSEMSNDGLKYT